MLGTVICDSIFLTGNRHNHIKRINGQITIGHMESYQEVFIRIGKVVNSQAHHRRTHISSLGYRTACKLDIIVITRIIRCIRFTKFISTFHGIHHITAHRLYLTVIRKRTLVTHNLHNHHTSFHNLQPTIANVEADVVVVVGIGELACIETHRVDTHCRTRSGGVALEYNTCGIVRSIRGTYRIARNALLITQILVDIGITGNQHFHIRLVDGQVTIRHIEDHIGECAIPIGEL